MQAIPQFDEVLQALARCRWAACLLLVTGCGLRTPLGEMSSTSSGGAPGTGMVGTGAEAGTPYNPYVWVVIKDAERTDCDTSAPGAEIDAVALWNPATETALGWGKVGTADFWANPAGNSCDENDCRGDDCTYAVITKRFLAETLVAWTEGPKAATVSATSEDYDAGYLALNGGTLEIQMGNVDGNGLAQALEAGDHVKVFEVDQTYVASGDVPANCDKCLPKHYTVAIRTAQGNTLQLKPISLAAENTTCSPLTGASTEGCGTTVFTVP